MRSEFYYYAIKENLYLISSFNCFPSLFHHLMLKNSGFFLLVCLLLLFFAVCELPEVLSSLYDKEKMFCLQNITDIMSYLIDKTNLISTVTVLKSIRQIVFRIKSDGRCFVTTLLEFQYGTAIVLPSIKYTVYPNKCTMFCRSNNSSWKCGDLGHSMKKSLQ